MRIGTSHTNAKIYLITTTPKKITPNIPVLAPSQEQLSSSSSNKKEAVDTASLLSVEVHQNGLIDKELYAFRFCFQAYIPGNNFPVEAGLNANGHYSNLCSRSYLFR